MGVGYGQQHIGDETQDHMDGLLVDNKLARRRQTIDFGKIDHPWRVSTRHTKLKFYADLR